MRVPDGPRSLPAAGKDEAEPDDSETWGPRRPLSTLPVGVAGLLLWNTHRDRSGDEGCLPGM